VSGRNLGRRRGKTDGANCGRERSGGTKRKLFLALCRRYGLKPYRERGQRSTSVMSRAPKSFQDKTLWPEYQALSAELNAHLEELTKRVLREAIDDDVSEASDDAPKSLGSGVTNQEASVGEVEPASANDSPTKSSR
jgi:hypothetical protein